MNDLNDIINDFLNSDLDVLLGYQYAKIILMKYYSKMKIKKNSSELITYMKRDINSLNEITNDIDQNLKKKLLKESIQFSLTYYIYITIIQTNLINKIEVIKKKLNESWQKILHIVYLLDENDPVSIHDIELIF
tara:strand:- start:413 stop:814 length:402 start_codon:yes stop_codon:yes gene_type:complete